MPEYTVVFRNERGRHAVRLIEARSRAAMIRMVAEGRSTLFGSIVDTGTLTESQSADVDAGGVAVLQTVPISEARKRQRRNEALVEAVRKPTPRNKARAASEAAYLRELAAAKRRGERAPELHARRARASSRARSQNRNRSGRFAKGYR